MVIKKFVKFAIFFLIFQFRPNIWPICWVNLVTTFQISRQTATSYFNIVNPKKLVKSLFWSFVFLTFQLRPYIWQICCVNLANTFQFYLLSHTVKAVTYFDKFFCAPFLIIFSIRKFVKIKKIFLIFQLRPYIWPICCVNLATTFQLVSWRTSWWKTTAPSIASSRPIIGLPSITLQTISNTQFI